VVDAEIIAMVRRLLAGIEARDESLGAALIRAVGHRGQFLGQKHTTKWFAREQHIPSEVVDRASLAAWEGAGRLDAADRARRRAASLLATYEDPPLAPEVRRELRAITLSAARRYGMGQLPPLGGEQAAARAA
jgi:trimethylamine--corrinoid protein Co-methyltransferase